MTPFATPNENIEEDDKELKLQTKWFIISSATRNELITILHSWNE